MASSDEPATPQLRRLRHRQTTHLKVLGGGQQTETQARHRNGVSVGYIGIHTLETYQVDGILRGILESEGSHQRRELEDRLGFGEAPVLGVLEDRLGQIPVIAQIDVFDRGDLEVKPRPPVGEQRHPLAVDVQPHLLLVVRTLRPVSTLVIPCPSRHDALPRVYSLA